MPAPREITHNYDAVSNVQTKADALGSRTYKYDPNHRIIEQDLPDGKKSNWTYDNGGRPIQAVDWNGTFSTIYDVVNRKTQETAPSGKSIKHGYDPMGNETSRTDYFGNKYAYVYDALNRPIQVTDPLNGVTGMVYDRMQHVLQIHYPNKTSVNTTYDATYDVASVVNKKDSGAIISQFAYTYDAVGNKLTVTDNIGKTTYAYDDIYQLTNAAYPDRPAVAYAYDPAGNRAAMTVGTTNTTYSYDAANKLMTAGTVSYTYDGNGNPVKKTDSSNNQTTTYNYDTENRLVGTTLPTGSQFVFGYDYTGWKISDTQKGPAGILNTQTYLWSGGSVVNEDGDDGQIAHNLVGEVNLSQIYTPKITKNPMVSYYAFDGLGSVADVTDVTGNITDGYRYDAYGATLSGGKNKDNHYQFVGRMGVENQAYIGLLYMRNRWYDSNVGRFMTQDPSDIQGGLNLYRYCINNPINSMDFMGLCGSSSNSSLQKYLYGTDYTSQGLTTNLDYQLLYDQPTSQGINGVVTAASMGMNAVGIYQGATAAYDLYSATSFAGNLSVGSLSSSANFVAQIGSATFSTVGLAQGVNSMIGIVNNSPPPVDLGSSNIALDTIGFGFSAATSVPDAMNSLSNSKTIDAIASLGTGIAGGVGDTIDYSRQKLGL